MDKFQGINTIIFDLGGVILNVDYQKTIKAFESLGVRDFKSVFSQSNQSKLADDFEVGKISEEEFYRELKVISGVEFSFEEYKKAWNSILLDLPQSRIELLKQLSKKYPLFLFSNTNETHYKEFVKKTEKDFKHIFKKTYFSHILGQRKPNKEAFLTILKDNQLNKEETLFVDDSIQHIQSAEELGLNVLFIKDFDITDEFV